MEAEEVSQTAQLNAELREKRRRITKLALAALALYIVAWQLGKMAADKPNNTAVHLKPELRYALYAAAGIVALYVVSLVYDYLTTTVVMTKEDFDMNRRSFRKLLKVDREFKIGKLTLDRFYQRFVWIDVDASNRVELEEFLSYFDLEDMFFTRRIFRVIDTDNSGALDFIEFVLSCYNYCTKDWEGLVRFTFELFDEDGDESLDVDELENLVQLVHGRKIDDRVSAVMERIEMEQRDRGGALSFPDFAHFARLFPVLVYPLIRIQATMRARLLGEGFWINESLRLAKRLRARGKKTVLHSLVDLGITKVEHAAHSVVRRLSAVVQHGRRLSTVAAGKMGIISADAVAAAAAAAASRKGRSRFQAAKRALSMKFVKKGVAAELGAAAAAENHVRAGAVMAVRPHSLKIKREALKRSAAEASNIRRFGNAAKAQAAYVPERDPKYIMAWKHTLHNLEASGDDPKLLDPSHFERFLDAMTGHIASIEGQHERLSSWARLAVQCGALGFVLLLVAASTDWWIRSDIVDVAMPQKAGSAALGWEVGGGPLRTNATTHWLAQGWGAFQTSGDAFATRSVPEAEFCLVLQSVGYCSALWAVQALLLLALLCGGAAMWYAAMAVQGNEGAWTPGGLEVLTVAGGLMALEALWVFITATVVSTAYVSALQQSNPLVDEQAVASGARLSQQLRACPWTNLDSNKVKPWELLHEVTCTYSVSWSFGLAVAAMLLSASATALLAYDDARDTNLPEVTVAQRLRELRDEHCPRRLLLCCCVRVRDGAVVPEREDEWARRRRAQHEPEIKLGPGRVTIIKKKAKESAGGVESQPRAAAARSPGAGATRSAWE